MARYLITHSLLSSWLYTMKENPYEDITTARDQFAEFLTTLRRELTETTEAMQNGINFEDLVTDIANGNGDPKNKWYEAAAAVATRVSGGVLQCRVLKEIQADGLTLVLYGRLDCLKAGEIIDIKFTKNYDAGKYYGSTQHPTYFELVPEADRFTYLVSNGREVWSETYRRDETASIYPIITDFLNWLKSMNLMDLYLEKWLAK